MLRRLSQSTAKWKYLLLWLMFLLIVLFHWESISTIQPIVLISSNSMSSSLQHSEDPVIFLLDRKTKFLFKTSTWKKMKMCRTPEKLRPLAVRLCSATRGPSSCEKEVPCSLLYSADRQRIHCFRGGLQVSSRNTSNSRKKIQCQTSRTLDAFDSNRSYPSLLVDRYPLSGKLFNETLYRSFRSSSSVWAFAFTYESIRHYSWAGNRALLSLFHLTMGYDRKLYDILTPAYLSTYQTRLTMNRSNLNEVLRDKMNVSSSFVRSSILYINSNCNPPSGRGTFMEELMKSIDVDAWGHCHRNRQPQELPEAIVKIHRVAWKLSHYTGDWVNSKMAMSKSYLFTIAIENSLVHDYVTEKLWQPLVAGSVPIYWGAPNIEDWLPCEKCIIDLRKYSDPKQVAKLITNLSKNRTLYAEYHQWRERPIPATFLRLMKYFERTRERSLECLICDLAHSKNATHQRKQVLDQIGSSE